MRALAEHLQAEVDRVLALENPAAEMTYELLVGDESFIIRHEDDRAEVLEGDWGSSDGPALELDAEFAGLLPEELDGEEVRLIAYVGTAPVVQFVGDAELISESNTKLEAVSSWQYVIDYTLEAGLEIENKNAQLLAYELLSKAPYRGRVTVEEVQSPKTNRQDDRRVPEYSSMSEALEMVTEDSEVVFRDTAVDGHRAGPKMSLSVPGEPVFTFEPIRHYDPDGGISVKRDSKKVGKIVAWRAKEFGVEILAEQIIDPDLSGFVEDIEIRDEIEPFAAAQRLVSESALHHRKGKYEIDIDTLFPHPTIERDDWVVVVRTGRERKRNGLFRFARRYLGFVTTHRGELPEKTGKIAVEAFKLSEELRPVTKKPRKVVTVIKPPDTSISLTWETAGTWQTTNTWEVA